MGKIKQKKNPKVILTVFLVLTLCWMGLIYWFSSNNGTDSGAFSGNLLKKLLSWFYPHWSERSAKEKAAVIARLHILFRKLGHFSEYCILGVFLTITVSLYCTYLSKRQRKYPFSFVLLPALLAFLYACSDEYHQKFVEGRSGEFRDVMIDFSGACLGILLTALMIGHIRQRRWRRRSAAQANILNN